MSPDDLLDNIMAVMDAAFDPAFGEAWTRSQVLGSLASPYCHYGLIDAQGATLDGLNTAAGFYMSRNAFDEEELLLLAVHPDARRRGLAVRLLDNLAEGATQRGISAIFLEMRDGNPAEILYRDWGFQPVGRRRNYYRSSNGEWIDAITFRKIL